MAAIIPSFDIRWFDTVDSTNNALAKDKSTLADKTVYAAHFQTAGRGQRGNSWESARDENLTFSILFKPKDLSATHQFALSEAVALGICDFLSGKGVKALIKWPNDIYAGDLKICGILIENTVSSAKLSACIAGIGFNLNQRTFASGARNPVSLKMLTTLDYKPAEALEELVIFIGKYYDMVSDSSGLDKVEELYLERLYRRGEWHRFEQMAPTTVPTEYRSGEPFTGRILGISETACLMIEKTDGSIGEYSFKEIKYIL